MWRAMGYLKEPFSHKAIEKILNINILNAIP